MATADGGEVWSGPKLAARLLALKGAAPDPVQHVIFRSTRRADGTLTEGYDVPGESQSLNDAQLDMWLTEHRLAGPERLAVAVLVINETLDASGRIAQCTLERRRGSADGPYCGEPARVDFAGAASAVRLYRSHLDGRLTEVLPSADTPPPGVRLPEQFAGEHKALEGRFGDAMRVLDAREPTLFEDMVGLSSIAHVRMPDGREVGCGIGWHGAMPFVLEADFPRFATPLELLPEDAQAVDAALQANGLIRGETRLDENGIAIVARHSRGEALFLLRPQAGQVRVEPYSPSRSAAGPDQQRWMRYAESYEGLSVLDTWRDGASDDLIVLTGDPSGQIWQHHVDPDGVETWRKVADDAAIGALHREHLVPGAMAAKDEEESAQEDDLTEPIPQFADRRSAAHDSVLARSEAYVRAMDAIHAMATLHEARDTSGMADIAAMRVGELHAALLTLDVHATAAAAHDLLAWLERGTFSAAGFAHEVARIKERLCDELALMRMVTVAPPLARLLDHDVPPFGEAVASAFPGDSYDIEEAGLCLALRRPTAAVFHCMKVLERGIGALARCVGIADPVTTGEREWQVILRLLRDVSDTGFGDLREALDVVRRRWRGATLQPADKYTEAEAELIFHAVGVFITTLAKRCDEQGRMTNGVLTEPREQRSLINDRQESSRQT